MATANVLELETCLKEALEFCRKHTDYPFVEFFLPRLELARKKWEESVTTSDRYYLDWQREFIEDKIAWKRLGAELRATQKMLHRIGAEGFPTTVVYHWDEEILAAAVHEMIDYLQPRTDVIAPAADAIDQLTRLLDGAGGENQQVDDALHEYSRHVLFRAEAMGTLSAVLGQFRESMRRNLGKKNELYQSIRWPISLSPDEPVL